MRTFPKAGRFAPSLPALALLALGACGPGDAEEAPGNAPADAEAAEAPPIQRPTSAPDFSEWDREGDMALAPEEFGAWAEDQGIFDGWSTDEGIDFEAMQEDIHSSLDVSGDGQVDRNDWDAVEEQLRGMFGGEHPGEWEEWDRDGDGTLSVEEFRTGAGERDLRGQVDVDGNGQLTPQDLQGYYFRLLDENRDGLVDLAEWSANLSVWVDYPM